MIFREYFPTKLNSLVHSIFERKVNGPMQVQFLPDGTVSLIFTLGERIKSAVGRKVDSNVFNPTETFCFVTGLHTEPLYFQMGGLHSFGLNMHPSAVRAFWGVPVKNLQDMVIPWEMAGDLAYIEDHIRGMDDFDTRARWLEDYFFEKLKRIELGLPIKLLRVARQMEKDLITGLRPDIYAYSGYSKMHTNRIFQEWMGLPPGKLLRYRQYRRALNMMHSTSYSLTQIGLECGFYDQAHFIRVFKEFADMTPGQYLRNKTPLPGILPW